MHVFDRHLVRLHRERAAAGFDTAAFLVDHAAEGIADRLRDLRVTTPVVLDLGARDGRMDRALADRSDITLVVRTETVPGFARETSRPCLLADEEALPFAPASFDLAVSCLNLHWVNDLPGSLLQIRRALRPDGVFMAAMFGGDTLAELRAAFLEAELELVGGVSPRVSPFAGMQDAAGLLQRAGFALPVVDHEILQVTYPSPFHLMRELRFMGETAAHRERRSGLARRDVMQRAAAIYGDRFGREDGRVGATFEILYLAGWAPAPTQPRPLQPGTATHRLADVLGTEERDTGVPVADPRVTRPPDADEGDTGSGSTPPGSR